MYPGLSVTGFNMQFSTHLGIFVRLNTRRKIPFELENTVSLAAKTQSSVHSMSMFYCAPQFFLQMLLCSASTFPQSIKQLPRMARFQPLPSKRVLSSKSKISNQNLGIGSSCPSSAAACFFAIKSCPHSRCCQPKLPLPFCMFSSL